MEVYQKALTEAVDVIVIDQQPQPYLYSDKRLDCRRFRVCGQTMKGFDLSTLTGYVTDVRDYTSVVTEHDPAFPSGMQIIAC